jgi:hypothetical protein
MRRRTPKTKRQRILAEIAEIVDVAFSIAPNVTVSEVPAGARQSVTWREQIVEEEVKKDGAA